ncbi:MAG: MFS transporter [Bacteroidota bacterium]
MNISNIIPKKIFPILLVNFIGILGYSVVVPILIFIVVDFGGNGFIYGLLGAMYPFFQFIGAPILGRLSDRIGRKKVLLISQLGTFIEWIFFLIAFLLPNTELWSQDNDVTGSYIMTLPLIMIFIARIFDGFTGGNVSVANAYLSDISTDEDRDKNFAKMGASTSTGFIIGPVLAGLLASTVLGEALPLIIAAIISLIAIFVIKVQLKESNPCVVDTTNTRSFRRFFQVEHRDCYTEGEKEAGVKQKGWQAVLNQPGIPKLYAVYFLTFLAFSLFYAGLPLYANTILNWTATDLGAFLSYSSIIMFITQGPILSKLTEHYNNKTLIIAGTLLLSVSFFLLTNPNTVILYLSMTILSLGNGIMWPSFMSLLAKTGDHSTQGSIQGYGSSMGSFASMIGLLVGGFLFESITVTVFIIGAILFLCISILMTLKSRRRDLTVTQTT